MAKDIVDTEDYGIGFNNEMGEVMIVTIPMRKWVDDKKYGDILVSGVFEKAKRVALKNMEMMRAQKKASGIVKAQPGVIPMPGLPS